MTIGGLPLGLTLNTYLETTSYCSEQLVLCSLFFILFFKIVTAQVTRIEGLGGEKNGLKVRATSFLEGRYPIWQRHKTIESRRQTPALPGTELQPCCQFQSRRLPFSAGDRWPVAKASLLQTREEFATRTHRTAWHLLSKPAKVLSEKVAGCNKRSS